MKETIFGKKRAERPSKEKNLREPPAQAPSEEKPPLIQQNGDEIRQPLLQQPCIQGAKTPEKCEPGKNSLAKEETPVTALESLEEEKDEEENAAVKLQAAFQGSLARKQVKKMKSSDQEENIGENK